MTGYRLRIVGESTVSNMLPVWKKFVDTINLPTNHTQFIRVRDEKLLYEYNAKIDKDRKHLLFRSETDAVAFKLRHS
jgi:hypothetical protein